MQGYTGSGAPPDRVSTGGDVVPGALAWLALFTLWAFCNPYFGVDGGSLIYSARALADLDPAGVGQDMMFRLDGQSAFTIFTPLFGGLAATLGLAWTTILTAAAAVVASFCGAAALASMVARGERCSLMIVFAAALPAYYGGFHLFAYAETAATPRPFAESLVLCGLAALLARKHVLATALMVCAFALHPIMALAGVGVLAIWLASLDRRWLYLITAVAIIIFLLGFARIAPFNRLATVVDPEWRGILLDRNPQLFPTLWLSGWVGRTTTRIATLLIAASLAPAPVRKLFLATIVVGLLGLAVAWLFGEKLSWLLVLQAQTWRTMWLVFAMSTFAAAFCVLDLWPRQGSSRVVLACLALAWVYGDRDLPGVVLAGAATALHFVIDSRDYRLSDTTVKGVTILASALVVAGLLYAFVSTRQVSAAAPADFAENARRTIALGYDYTAIAVLGAVWAVAGWPRPAPFAIIAIATVGVILVAGTWDQRSAANRYFDSGNGAPDLARIVAARPGEIYWMNGVRENWWWLRRAHWLSAVQGAAIVFSRGLAVKYKERGQRAIDAGLADEDVLTPLTEPHADDIPAITGPKIAAFCGQADAPAWVIAPLIGDERIPADVKAVEWTAPVVQLQLLDRDGAYFWQPLSRYAVVPCASG